MGDNFSDEEVQNLKRFARRIGEFEEFLDERKSWRIVRNNFRSACMGIVTVAGAVTVLLTVATWFFDFMNNRGK